MTNVQSPKATLTSALPIGAQGAYPLEFAAVAEALTERDYSLTDQITDVVVREFRVSRDVVRHQLSLAGMEVRPDPVVIPEVVASVADMSDFEEAMTAEAPAKKAKKGKKSDVAKLAKVVNKLVKAARRHGVTI